MHLLTLEHPGSPEIVFSLWHVQEGDRVFAGDQVAEVLIPGCLIDVVTPVTGTLEKQYVRPLDHLQPGCLLAEIRPYEPPKLGRE